MKQLSAQQLALLRECCQYSIQDDIVHKRWYRLGGSGYVPLRYRHDTMQVLDSAGLVARNGGYHATEAGQKLVADWDKGKVTH